MTVAELIEMLEEMPSDAPVRLAQQPSWPLATHVAGVHIATHAETGDEVVWLAEGAGDGYAPHAAWGE